MLQRLFALSLLVTLVGQSHRFQRRASLLSCGSGWELKHQMKKNCRCI